MAHQIFFEQSAIYKSKSSGPSKITSSHQITNNLYLCLAKHFKMNDWNTTAYLGGHYAIPSFGSLVELAVLTAAIINFQTRFS